VRGKKARDRRADGRRRGADSGTEVGPGRPTAVSGHSDAKLPPSGRATDCLLSGAGSIDLPSVASSPSSSASSATATPPRGESINESPSDAFRGDRR
jgi:hypothetical protein